ncbi:MAG: hypothetical protein AB7G17_00560 [Phycisphaerales bacterium]
MNRFTMALGLLTAASAFGAGQAGQGNNANAQQVRVSLAANDPRPLAAAMAELEFRHRVPISYEDAPYVLVTETQDVTEQVRLDLAEFAPGQAPRVIVPRGGSFTFGYEVSATDGQPGSIKDVIQSAIDAHSAKDLAGRYRVVETSNGYAVVPVAHRDGTARLVGLNAALDARISVAESSRNGIDALEELCRAVSKASGTPVVIGTAPATLLGRHTTTISARNEPARDVLARLFGEFNVGLSWQMFHDPAGDFYALNIHIVE